MKFLNFKCTSLIFINIDKQKREVQCLPFFELLTRLAFASLGLPHRCRGGAVKELKASRDAVICRLYILLYASIAVYINDKCHLTVALAFNSLSC